MVGDPEPQKNYLFIDGTNLYAGQYELFGPRKYLNFQKFIQTVEDKLKLKFNKIYFYASYSPQPKKPTAKEKLYLKNEALFYKSVKDTENLFFFKGYRSKTDKREKEVDVKLTVDIVHLTHLNSYDQLYFISEDADFAHALLIAKQLRKKVFILALENRIPLRFIYIFPTILLSFGRRKNLKRIIKQNMFMLMIRLSESCINRI